jgi:hypothetical protein
MQMRRIFLAFKALQELGLRQVGLYGLYQFGLVSGHYRRQFTVYSEQYTVDRKSGAIRTDLLALPDRDELVKCLGDEGKDRLFAEADEVSAGQVRLFGREQVTPLDLEPPGPLKPWTEYEKTAPAEDIKFTWEAARFGWAYTLGRAYRLSSDERYALAFWQHTENFLAANPAYLGPHWASAQEAALRLIALAWSAQVFAASPHSTPERMASLAQAIARHAARIPPTLVYARAQNNNHLLSEAAGLYTAGLALPEHPQAERWRELGWRWLERGLLSQIAEDGAYSQHSTNYHRLMLQLALWINNLAQGEGRSFAAPVQNRLQAATRWLLALLDPASGGVPNLGPNDGAYILPLTACPFNDYRPVLQAASQAFLGEQACQEGAWDEMGLWLRTNSVQNTVYSAGNTAPAVLRSPTGDSWAYLRAARFSGRPGHADQLHVDLWWKGLNIAQDPGTYRYNAPAPWNNALTHTAVHNTLIVNGLEQMRRAGRFLYLDWAQAQIVGKDEQRGSPLYSITARHDGYRRLGLIHQRTVRLSGEAEWIVEDEVLPSGKGHVAEISVGLQWLLCDSKQYTVYSLQYTEDTRHQIVTIEVVTEVGLIMLEMTAGEGINAPLRVQVVRAGELVYGEGHIEPTWGWSSPTYGDKIPALSVRVYAAGSTPLTLKSRFLLRG